jgi:hypothetical protein
MNERIKELYEQAHIERRQEYFSSVVDPTIKSVSVTRQFDLDLFAELILANADELKREVSTDPINKPFELNPKFVAKCDEIGRSRRQFQ